jgi:hypothetical protein
VCVSVCYEATVLRVYAFLWNSRASVPHWQFVSGTMGVWMSLVFDRHVDSDDAVEDWEEPIPTRRTEEDALADSCRLVHEKNVTLMMYLTANPRDHVNELCRSIEEGTWSEEARSVLKTIWNSMAARWFCAAVEFDEEKKDAVPDNEAVAVQAVQDTVALEVPWDKEWGVTDCALLIRSICLGFPACYLDGVCH